MPAARSGWLPEGGPVWLRSLRAGGTGGEGVRGLNDAPGAPHGPEAVRTVLFDLDGTLVDSQAGIVEGFRRATRAIGLSLGDDLLHQWIGPPLAGSLLGLGVAPADLARALAAYREYYTATGLYQAALYDGVLVMLEELRAAGVVLGVATAKVVDLAVAVTEHFGIRSYFDVICGAGPDGPVEKAYIVADAMAQLGRSWVAPAVVVGDRRYDMEAATANGLPGVGAAWGYGDIEELRDAGASMLVSSPRDLAAVLLAAGPAPAGPAPAHGQGRRSEG